MEILMSSLKQEVNFLLIRGRSINNINNFTVYHLMNLIKFLSGSKCTYYLLKNYYHNFNGCLVNIAIHS